MQVHTHLKTRGHPFHVQKFLLLVYDPGSVVQIKTRTLLKIVPLDLTFCIHLLKMSGLNSQLPSLDTPTTARWSLERNLSSTGQAEPRLRVPNNWPGPDSFMLVSRVSFLYIILATVAQQAF